MRKIAVPGIVAAVLTVCCAIQTLAQAQFKPPEVTSASDIQYPILSVVTGVVVLDLSLDANGVVTGNIVQRGILSLTSVATSSIQSWKFAAGSSLGKPQSSTMRIAFVFRPRSYFAADPPFAPLLTGGDPSRLDQAYIPPGMISVVYPQYPINAVVPGTVVMQVTVGKSNSIEHLKIVRDLSPFTQLAVNAVRKWRFQAGTLEGRPTSSNLAIAFVFPTLSGR